MLAEENHTIESPQFRKSSSKHKRRKSSQKQKSPRLTFDQQIDLLPEFKPPVLLATSAMCKDYIDKARDFIDANIVLFDSECYFKPKINEKSKQIVRSTSVHEDLYAKSMARKQALEMK